MPETYNLRRSQRRKDISVRQCYLHALLEKKSPEVFNPKVRLERLKVLECHDIQRSRFYLEKGKITIKRNESFLLRKKFWLKIFCFIILLMACSLYWKDFQVYGSTFVKKWAEIQPTIQSYYSNAVKFQQKVFKRFNYKQPKPRMESKKSVSPVTEEEYSPLHDDLQIRQLVQDYFAELKKKNKFESIKPSFIEDQCKSSVRDTFISVKKSFHNVTVPELANYTDYALESQGAKIVSVFNTELYGTITVKFMNFNLWPGVAQFFMNLESFSSNGPNSILVPWKKPGDCWAFKGSHGRVEIELSKKIVITAVTIDHIPKEIAPYGSIQSAPKKFSVIGIEQCENQFCKTYLGSYEYKNAGPPTQTFIINPMVETSFERIEIDIQSNHGNNEYTCVYKVRVHGYK